MAGKSGIFVSSLDIGGTYEQSVVQALREDGHDVFHSPYRLSENDKSWVFYSPSRNNVGWGDWYNFGQNDCLAYSWAYLAILSEDWTASTWMAHESDAAQKLYKAGGLTLSCYINPYKIDFHERFPRYMEKEIPSDLASIRNIFRQGR